MSIHDPFQRQFLYLYMYYVQSVFRPLIIFGTIGAQSTVMYFGQANLFGKNLKRTAEYLMITTYILVRTTLFLRRCIFLSSHIIGVTA